MEKINGNEHKNLTAMYNIFCDIFNFMNYYNIVKLHYILMILMELFETAGLFFHFRTIKK